MATSFQKKTRIKAVQILGTKPSLHNNQLLVSTGVPSLDNVIGIIIFVYFDEQMCVKVLVVPISPTVIPVSP